MEKIGFPGLLALDAEAHGLGLLVALSGAGALFDKPRAAQGLVGSVFREGLERPRRGFHGDELLQLGHPNALGLQIRLEVAWGYGRDVHADAAFFLCQSPAVDFRSPNGFGSCDAALS